MTPSTSKEDMNSVDIWTTRGATPAALQRVLFVLERRIAYHSPQPCLLRRPQCRPWSTTTGDLQEASVLPAKRSRRWQSVLMRLLHLGWSTKRRCKWTARMDRFPLSWAVVSRRGAAGRTRFGLCTLLCQSNWIVRPGPHRYQNFLFGRKTVNGQVHA